MIMTAASKQKSKEPNRRDFIRVATAAAGAFAVAPILGCASEDAGPEAACDPVFDGVCLPSLGGAPDTHDGHVIAAFVDTIVPGAHRDPEGKPGGIDVDAPAMFFDEALPAAEFVPLLVVYLDGVSRRDFGGREFVELEYDERDSAVAAALDGFEPAALAVQMAKLAFYSSEGAARYLGYPGPNGGYYDHPDFTFGAVMATEITDDGNLA
jgi:hypothetical protein